MNDFLALMKPMIPVLAGGFLTILGGMIATWYQAKNARRIRMDEIIAEKKVTINQEAYSRIVEIISMLTQSTLQETNRKILEYEDWFFESRLFLPGKFPDKWRSLRLGLFKALMLQKKSPKTADEVTKLKEHLDKLAEEAREEIYKEMKLERIEVEYPPKS